MVVGLSLGSYSGIRRQERAFVRACPTARLAVVRRATHLVNLVRPVAYNRELLGILDQVHGRPAE